MGFELGWTWLDWGWVGLGWTGLGLGLEDLGTKGSVLGLDNIQCENHNNAIVMSSSRPDPVLGLNILQG